MIELGIGLLAGYFTAYVTFSRCLRECKVLNAIKRFKVLEDGRTFEMHYDIGLFNGNLSKSDQQLLKEVWYKFHGWMRDKDVAEM